MHHDHRFLENDRDASSIAQSHEMLLVEGKVATKLRSATDPGRIDAGMCR